MGRSIARRDRTDRGPGTMVLRQPAAHEIAREGTQIPPGFRFENIDTHVLPFLRLETAQRLEIGFVSRARQRDELIECGIAIHHFPSRAAHLLYGRTAADARPNACALSLKLSRGTRP